MNTLLLHGIPGNAKSWSEVVPLLSPDFHVLTPDLLGFGDSPDPSGDGHAVEQAAVLRVLLDRMAIDRVHVVGFDFGGPVAVELYRLVPSRFASLCLVASNVATDNPVPPPLRLARVPVAGELLFQMMCSGPGLAMMRRGVRRVNFSAKERRTTRRIFLQSLRNLTELYAPIEALLPQIKVPVSVVWGTRDPFFSVDAGRRTAGRIRGAAFTVLDCGHFVPEEKPAELADAIRSLAQRSRE